MDQNIQTARDEHVKLSKDYLLCDWSGEVSFLIRTENYNKCNTCKKVLWSIFDEVIDYCKSVRGSASW